MNQPASNIAALASKFCERMREALSAEEFATMVSRNKAEPHKDICHSHDFVDANEMMADAFRLTEGREVDLQSDDDTSLWNAAWNRAKAAGFDQTVRS